MAISTPRVYIESDNFVRVVGVRDASTGSFENAADTITFGLYNSSTNIVPTTFADAGGGDVTITVPAGNPVLATDYVWIEGTTNYNGEYEVQCVTDTTIVITATYVAETPTTAYTKIYRGIVNARGLSLTIKANDLIEASPAAAVDLGDGTVDIPCNGHGYQVGDSLTIAGSDAYDDTWVVQAIKTNYFSIKDTYAAEVFVGDETITPGGIYTATMPSTAADSLVPGLDYAIYVNIVEGAVDVTIKKTFEAAYYEGS